MLTSPLYALNIESKVDLFLRFKLSKLSTRGLIEWLKLM